MITKSQYLKAQKIIDAYHEEQRKIELGENIVPLNYGDLPDSLYSKIITYFAYKGISPKMVTLNHIQKEKSVLNGISPEWRKLVSKLLAKSGFAQSMELSY